jgi:thiol-disulfide isomerase/thioredoxin
MKKILPIIAVFLTAITVLGQSNIILQQDFEDGLGEWMVADFDSLEYNDYVSESFSDPAEAWKIFEEDGNNYAMSCSYYNYTADVTAASDWLISPVIKLTQNNTLSWRGMARDPDFPDGYVVMMENITGDSTMLVKYITAEAPEWTSHSFDLSAFEGDSVQFYFVNNSSDMFYLRLDDIVVAETPELDLAMESLTLANYALVGSADITGVVSNKGLSDVSNFEVTYTINGAGSMTATITPSEAIALNNMYEFTIEDAITMEAVESYEVEVTITAVNGTTDEADNNVASGSIAALSEATSKNVLVEEYSGAWCGWCPDGARLLEDLMTNNNNVIGVTVHAGDDMEIEDAAGILTDSYVAGYPSGSIDRVLFEGEDAIAAGRYDWDSLNTVRTSHLTPVSVSGNVEYDAESREVTIKVDAKLFGNILGKDFRVNAYILEDSVTGTGEGYDQVNYISAPYIPNFGWTGSEPGYTEESPIVGYNHMKVLRKMLGGSFGTENIIASPTVDGSTYSHTYTTTLDDSFDPNNVSVVLLAQEYNQEVNMRPILNSAKIKLPVAAIVVDTTVTDTSVTDTASSITEFGNQLTQIAIYPNPTSGNTQVSFALTSYENIIISVKNLQGQTIFTENIGRATPGYYNYSLETANFVNGMYIVNIETSKGSKNLTLIKQ